MYGANLDADYTNVVIGKWSKDSNVIPTDAMTYVDFPEKHCNPEALTRPFVAKFPIQETQTNLFKWYLDRFEVHGTDALITKRRLNSILVLNVAQVLLIYWSEFSLQFNEVEPRCHFFNPISFSDCQL